MTKINHVGTGILMVMLIAVLVFWAVHVRAGQIEIADLVDQEQIKDTVQDYFEMRYHYLSTLQSKDFGSLFAKIVQENSFHEQEKEKMEIELYHAELYGLKYVEYEYALDFRDVSIDIISQTANVSLFEGHDIVFEVSLEISKDKPIISSMRNLHHSIGLQKMMVFGK